MINVCREVVLCVRFPSVTYLVRKHELLEADAWRFHGVEEQVAQRATIAHLSPMCQGQISFKKTYTLAMETGFGHLGMS